MLLPRDHRRYTPFLECDFSLQRLEPQINPHGNSLLPQLERFLRCGGQGNFDAKEETQRWNDHTTT